MEFGKYISELLPSFGKDRIQDDLDAIDEELTNHTLPVYTAANKQLGDTTLLHPQNKADGEWFEKNLEYKYKGNQISGILSALEQCPDHVKTLQTMVDEEFAIDINQAGMTSLRVNIIHLAEIIGFVTRYSRRYLHYLVILEQCQQTGKEISDHLTPGELDWLKDGKYAFARGLTIVQNPPKDIEKQFKKIPDVLITPETAGEVEKVAGKKAIDPLRMGFVPLVLNPIYHVRIAIAEWQAARYKEAQEEATTIELRLLRLKQLKEGKDDAKLDKQIEYNEARLQKLAFKIAKVEQEYD